MSTVGFDVFVQLVIAAMTIEPSFTFGSAFASLSAARRLFFFAGAARYFSMPARS
jgi:hypothetical protein